ncbi:M14 family metallopeptidase [Acetobacterium sp.]|uniref:M14 family metallopeptidase n=1 Tax=Acetobacterium sp. TaxID=1872094 RepID=UPI000CB23A87|nr:M14 family metallopeptidase [Acetobacterium sp.]MDO9491546.1 M14 family metallopeptidase [Acetobacterium sp.]PKM75424.1 MAG: succinylglutamate desuccinylase [Firmicutes bacterium HGW-Firmicutes-17]
MKIKIENLSVEKGHKTSAYIPVPQTDLSLPVTIINGEKVGKTVLITSGIHNAEYTGIQTAIELAAELQPDEVNGCLILIHPVNISGFENRTMSAVAEDGKNLNRLFPGNANGTMGDKIAHFIVTAFLSQTDYYIDLHAGDGFETLTPYVYYVGAAAAAVVEQSKAMAEKINVPYMVKSFTATGGAYNYAGSCGIPGILIERGGEARWSKAEIHLYKADVKNVLRSLKVLNGAVNQSAQKPVDVVDVIYETARVTGCWYPNQKPGEFVKKGATLGVIKDYFGNVLAISEAEYDGVVLYQVSSLCVIENDILITYGKVAV